VKSLDRDGRSLEEVVRELTDIYYPVSDETLREENEYLQKIDNETYVARVKIHRLKAELRKYLSRSEMFAKQIDYIRSVIKEIEDEHPELKND